MFIKDMLKEELLNSEKIREDYKQAVQNLPKGSIVRKRIGGHDYIYLAYRDGGKVRFDYIGKPDEEMLAKHQEAQDLRKRYRKKISEVNEQITFIRKALRG